MTKKTVHFAVVDIETTGLFPAKHDRIVEFACMLLGADGREIEYYETLINPERDIGPTHIHGISAKDVIKAPTFKDVMDDILYLLKDAVLVAHNARFDWGFIAHEFKLNGRFIPELPRACTIQLARRIDSNIPGHKLSVVCDYLDIPFGNAHTAMGDVRGSAGILREYTHHATEKEGSINLKSIVTGGDPEAWAHWPQSTPAFKVMPRQENTKKWKAQETALTSFVDRLPSVKETSSEIEEYLALLDLVMEDRRITPDEAESLLALAENLGFFREQINTAHQLYIKELLGVALEDGIISDSEMADLNMARDLLGIRQADFYRILAHEQKIHQAGRKKHSPSKQIKSYKGKWICFTGALQNHIDGKRVTKAIAQKYARENGLTVKKSVTQDLDILVAADKYTQSGKAKRARSYNIRIIDESEFWAMLGILTE